MGLFAIEQLIPGGFDQVLDFVREIEAIGVDMVTAHDHVAVGNINRQDYPGSKSGFHGNLDDSWPESIALLAALSSVTSRLRLGASVLVAPLRHSVLLAKQLATLDYISGGRTEIGLGAGWQEAEFQASGIAFKDRFAYLDEQISAMRALWEHSPGSYSGRLIVLNELFVKPSPIQHPLPIWLGVLNVTDKGVNRMARLANGWFAGHDTPAQIGASILRVHEAMRGYGRDPSSFRVHVDLPPVPAPDGSTDIDATLASAVDYIRAGVTHVGLMPSRYFTDVADDEGHSRASNDRTRLRLTLDHNGSARCPALYTAVVPPSTT